MPTPPWLRDLVDQPVPHRVRDFGAGMKAVDYLVSLVPALNAASAEAALRDGLVRREEGPVDPDAPLDAGESLQLHLPPSTQDDPFLPTPLQELTVLHLDPALLVIDKPSGLLSYPLGPRRIAALSIAERQLRNEGRADELRPLHRLDRETSGVLMMARDLQADRRIKKAFQKRRVAKSYLALVRGRFPGGVQIIDAPIGPAGGEIRLQMAVREDGRAAVTWVRNLGSFGDDDWGPAGCGYTWVEARPRTGRQHQIRVHLASRGHPIVGDKLYCGTGRAFLRRWEGRLEPSDIEQLGLPRHGLHAWKIALQHPAGSGPFSVTAPVPADLLAFARARGGSPPMSGEDLEVPS